MSAEARDGYPLVLVRWEDSRQPRSAWTYVADLADVKPVQCATVGWLVNDGEDAKAVCQNVGDLLDPQHAQASGIMVIPARCILEIRLLKEGKGFTSLNPSSRPGSARKRQASLTR
jgi:hypothetical protein